MTFVDDLTARSRDSLDAIIAQGRTTSGDTDTQALLQVALVNEINVAELAASWVATTPEVDAKLAFARQAGDEAGHFQLVAERLRAQGFDVDAFVPPAKNPLFAYIASLSSTVERVAASLFALEAIAYGVNENFIAYCRARGDLETVRLYDEIIQPEEREHQAIGRALLAKYAVSAADQTLASTVVGRVLEIATSTRAAAATKLGIACFPGC